MTLWLICIGMALGMGVWLFYALVTAKPVEDEHTERQLLNATIFKERNRELDNDFAMGNLDEARYQALKLELQRSLLQDTAQETAESTPSAKPELTMLSLTVVFAVPLAAILAYAFTPQQAVERDLLTAHEQLAPLVRRALLTYELPELPREAAPDFVRVLQRTILAERPRDAAAWALLGGAYLALGAANESAQALGRAHQLDRDHLDYALHYAQALVVQNDGKLNSDSARLLQQVLTAQPRNGGALWLLGFGAYNLGDYEKALLAWRTLDAQLDPEDERTQQLRLGIADVERRLTVTAPVAEPEVAQDNETVQVAITVDIDPALRDQISPDDTLFVFAKAATGTPMPLAVVRTTAMTFPMEVTLSDQQAMMEALSLSTATEIIVNARISRQGDVIPRTGDLEGTSPILALNGGRQQVAVTIDHVLP